jgi:hypothetical protein
LAKNLIYSLVVFLFLFVRSSSIAIAQEYVLLGWNDLGMHCSNQYFSKVVVLPPYNNVSAQLILRQPGQVPRLVTSGYIIEYSIPNNTYSVGKTDFWTYAQQLFGLASPLPANIGLTGKGLTGVLDSSGNYFAAHGIPITPFADSDLVNENPFQLIHLVAKNKMDGTVLATTDAVIPVSNEVGCVQSGCHSSENDILNRHESVTGFNRNGPVLCASCHASNALGTTGNSEAGIFSMRIHSKHADVAGPANSISTCYKCHPGPKTQCLRDIMGKNPTNPMVCQNCHGTMSNVASTIRDGRQPWLQEPRCGDCHGATYAEEPGKLFRQSQGHGGLNCSACHGSPHAILPTVEPNDNLQNIRLQGYAGTLRKCSVCHATPPNGPGPHGIMDSVLTVLQAPALVSPSSGMSGISTLLRLQWNAPANAVTYHLEVSTDSAFGSSDINDSTLVNTYEDIGPLNSTTTYFWRVRAKNSGGTSAWSDAWNFTTGAGAVLAVPALSLPLNSASAITVNPRLQWNVSEMAQTYTLQVSFDSAFGTTVINDSAIANNYRDVGPLSNATTYFWRVRAKYQTLHSAWSETWSFTTGSNATYTLAINERWNLISLPVVVENSAVSVQFPTSASLAYGYVPNTGYAMQSSLAFGAGYWLKFGSAQSVSVIGVPVLADTIDVDAGWNLIGSISIPVAAASITPIGTSVVSEYFGYNGGYARTDTIVPAKAYWVKTGNAGKLALGGGAMAKPTGGSHYVDHLNRLTAEDAAGNIQMLYFGNQPEGAFAPDRFEMPPAPPQGAFDVRFSTGKFVEFADQNQPKEIPISISSGSYPVTIRWKMMPGQSGASLVLNGTEVASGAEGAVSILESGANLSLRFGASSVSTAPREFSLEQNYPNPFNPTTVIKYTLPSEGRVVLTVYNLVGEVIGTLVNGVQSAGVKSVEWNSGNYPSGIYFYRIEITGAGSPARTFTQGKKMLLIK